MTVSTKDNLAQIVLCSNLGYDPDDEKTLVKPFTTSAWSKIEDNYTNTGQLSGETKKVMSRKAPDIFYFCGEMRILETDTVAITGSREDTNKESEYAKKHAKILLKTE